MSRIVEVAAAVITRPDGSFLLGRRPAGTDYGGWWEFPGGKLEPGETPRQALVRELREELGIEVSACQPWITREFVYPHAHVRLHFFRVTAWQGEIRDLLHSEVAWQRPGAVGVEPMLPANAPVLKALRLPDFYAITQAATIGVNEQLARLERALADGLGLVQLREPDLAPDVREDFFRRAAMLAHDAGAIALANEDATLARRAGADGLHLKSAQLMGLSTRPDFEWVAASCHNAAELARAVELGMDFVVLGPLRPTVSHPSAPVLGWSAFSQSIENYPLPVYALGGLGKRDLETARGFGAHGIAAVRASWSDPPA